MSVGQWQIDTRVPQKPSDLAYSAPKVAQLIKNVSQEWDYIKRYTSQTFHLKVIFIAFKLFSISWCETKRFCFHNRSIDYSFRTFFFLTLTSFCFCFVFVCFFQVDWEVKGPYKAISEYNPRCLSFSQFFSCVTPNFMSVCMYMSF